MKLLVTGGCGFIGSAFVRLALSRGSQVVNLDKLTYAGNPANWPTRRRRGATGSCMATSPTRRRR